MGRMETGGTQKQESRLGPSGILRHVQSIHYHNDMVPA